MIGKILKKSFMFPAVFIPNTTRKQLYKANINRFFRSIYIKDEQYQEFRQVLAGLPYNNLRKRKMFIQFALLFHLTGMEAEEYMLLGGDEYSSFYAKLKYDVSRWRQNIFQFTVNKKPENVQIRKTLDDKELFNERYSDLLVREWITTDKSEKEISEFIKKHQNVIVKPLNGSSGKGIFKLSFSEYEKRGMSTFEGGRYIIEQILVQKGLLHQVNPCSVNTLRVNTLYKNGQAILLAVFLRTGRDGSVTDNFHSGGVLWQIDPHTGLVKFGIDAQGKFCDKHPDSGIEMVGRKVPRYEEAIEICLNAQNRTPEVPQIGWDVVISDDYIALIEGNSGPGVWNPDATIPAWPIMKKYLIDNNVKINEYNWT